MLKNLSLYVLQLLFKKNIENYDLHECFVVRENIHLSVKYALKINCLKIYSKQFSVFKYNIKYIMRCIPDIYK